MPGKNQDYYGDADSPAPQSPADKPEEQGAETTATLPKSILAGKDFKPGEEIVLRIVALHDDEVEVSYASDKGGEESHEEAPAPTQAEAPASMFE